MTQKIPATDDAKKEGKKWQHGTQEDYEVQL